MQHGQQQLLVLRCLRLDFLGRLRVGDIGHFHPERRTGPGCSRPDLRPALTAHHSGSAAAGDAADLQDLGDHTVRRVAVLQPRGDEQLTGIAGLRSVDGSLGGVVQRDRHDHSGQHDGVGNKQHRH